MKNPFAVNHEPRRSPRLFYHWHFGEKICSEQIKRNDGLEALRHFANFAFITVACAADDGRCPVLIWSEQIKQWQSGDFAQHGTNWRSLYQLAQQARDEEF